MKDRLKKFYNENKKTVDSTIAVVSIVGLYAASVALTLKSASNVDVASVNSLHRNEAGETMKILVSLSNGKNRIFDAPVEL